MSTSLRPIRILLIGTAALLAVLGLAAARADATPLSPSGCPAQQATQPFSRWLDPGSYVLVPQGSFEGGADGWTLTGDAGVVPGNEPWLVHNSADTSSLALPSGSSATSPSVCVTAASPTLRFFARSSSFSLLSLLRVDVVFSTTLGLIKSLPIGVVPALGSWQPTLPDLVLVNNLELLLSQYGSVSFRFTPIGAASWQIDDVYLDPWSKG